MCLYSSTVMPAISSDEYIILKDIYNAISKDDTVTMRSLTMQLLEIQDDQDKKDILNEILNNFN